MRDRSTTAIAFLPLFLISAMACATSGNEVNSLMREYEGNVPGASVLVLRDGRVCERGAAQDLLADEQSLFSRMSVREADRVLPS